MPRAVEVLGGSSVVDGGVVLDSETSVMVEESVVSLVVEGRVVVVSENSVAIKTLSVLVVVAEVTSTEEEPRETVEESSLLGRICVVSAEDTIEVDVEATSSTELVAPKELPVSVWLDSGLQGPAATSETPTAKHRRDADTLETYMMTKVLMMRRQDLGFFIRRVLGSR